MSSEEQEFNLDCRNCQKRSPLPLNTHSPQIHRCQEAGSSQTVYSNKKSRGTSNSRCVWHLNYNLGHGINSGVPPLIWPCFIALHRCCIFYELKGRPSPSKKMTTRFISILALLWWSGTDPVKSPRFAHIVFKHQKLKGWTEVYKTL